MVVPLDAGEPLLVGPDAFWDASEMPRVFVRAAFDTGQDEAALAWEGIGGQTGEVRFSVQPDGEMRTYEVDLSAAPGYTGNCKRLALRPVDAGRQGAVVRVEYVGARRPE